MSRLFHEFVGLTKRILAGECDKIDMTDDLKAALDDFKMRYTDVVYPHDIMLEDWFFVLEMYFLLYDVDKEAKAAGVAFKRLFLDAIYNEGKIQNIYQNMSKKVRHFLKDLMNFILSTMIPI